MYLSVKDLFESNYQLLINGREKARIKHDKNPQVFINYQQAINVYEKLHDYNPTKRIKVLTVFDEMIADKEDNKKLSLNCS